MNIHPGITSHTAFIPMKYTQKYMASGRQYARPSKKVVSKYSVHP
jgi:hypothetical protein